MNHSMRLFTEPFKNIKSGRKTIEIRLFDEKRQQVQIGDTITFTKLPDKDDVITVEVIGLSRFSNFRDFFTAFDKSKFAHPNDWTIEDQIQAQRDVYSVEEEQEYGMLGIHIRLT